MSEKHELASYMTSLLTLLEQQDKAGVHGRSQWLGAEFDRCWAEFKELIGKEQEQEDASRKSYKQHLRPKDTATNQRGEPGRSSTDRPSSDEPKGSPAVEGTGPDSTPNDFISPSRR